MVVVVVLLSEERIAVRLGRGVDELAQRAVRPAQELREAVKLHHAAAVENKLGGHNEHRRM